MDMNEIKQSMRPGLVGAAAGAVVAGDRRI